MSLGHKSYRLPSSHSSGELERVLLSPDRIQRRVRALAREVERDFAGRDVVVIALLTGTVMFLADLLRGISLPLRLDFMGVSSYGAGTESGDLTVTKELRLDVRGRDVLLVDDILDTGRTLRLVRERLRGLRPRRVRICVLLDKPSRRTERVRADYVGFTIPDVFVVGYGLDFAERFRNLPFIGVLRPNCGSSGTQVLAGSEAPKMERGHSYPPPRGRTKRQRTGMSALRSDGDGRISKAKSACV